MCPVITKDMFYDTFVHKVALLNLYKLCLIWDAYHNMVPVYGGFGSDRKLHAIHGYFLNIRHLAALWVTLGRSSISQFHHITGFKKYKLN